MQEMLAGAAFCGPCVALRGMAQAAGINLLGPKSNLLELL